MVKIQYYLFMLRIGVAFLQDTVMSNNKSILSCCLRKHFCIPVKCDRVLQEVFTIRKHLFLYNLSLFNDA